MLLIDIVREGVEPGRHPIDLAALNHAGQSRRRMITAERIDGRIAESLNIKRREQPLVEPYRHEPIVADKAVWSRSGSVANADLLSQLSERKPLVIDLYIRFLFHEQLCASLVPGPLLRLIIAPN